MKNFCSLERQSDPVCLQDMIQIAANNTCKINQIEKQQQQTQKSIEKISNLLESNLQIAIDTQREIYNLMPTRYLEKIKFSQQKQKKLSSKLMSFKEDDAFSLRNQMTELIKQKRFQIDGNSDLSCEKLEKIIQSAQQSVSESEQSSSGSYVKIRKSKFIKLKQELLCERIEKRILNQKAIVLKEKILSQLKQ